MPFSLRFNTKPHTVSHASKSKVASAEQVHKVLIFVSWGTYNFDGRDVKAVPKVILTRNFIAMTKIGNVTINNKIRLIAGNSS